MPGEQRSIATLAGLVAPSVVPVVHPDEGCTMDAMGGLGFPELLIVLLIIFLLFGATKLPKLARSIGEASEEFRKAVVDDDGTEVVTEEAATKTGAEVSGSPAEPILPTDPNTRTRPPTA